MNRISRFLKKVFFKIRLFLSDEVRKADVYADYYKVNMGKNIVITGNVSFGSEPYLITIGDNVRITDGVTFHNHDGGVGILRTKYPGIDVIKPINIGNNVFIGSHATIMPGVTVGNNVIIGASSVVTRDIPDDVVVAGIPAKIIKTLPEYEAKILQEAIYIKNRSNADLRKEEILKTLSEK